MQVPLQIAFHGVPSSEAVKSLIEEKVAWLEQFQSGIIACRVVIDAPPRHQRKGNSYQLHLTLTVPGGEIVVRRDPTPQSENRDLPGLVREAFEVARRQVEEHARRRRHEVKRHEQPPVGRITRLFPEQGYGFLRTAEGAEVYFHQNAVLNGDFTALEPGAEVTFVEVAGDEGPQASTIRLVARASHP